MSTHPHMRVVVSNGTYRFHLAPLAAELERMGCLAALITGAYPKSFWKQVLERSGNARIHRLLARREALPDERVLTCDLSETIFKVGDLLFGRHWQDAQQWVHRKAFSQYAGQAARYLRSLDFDIYHYRNCFGGVSASQAREAGRKTICDHSIGHPYAVSFMRRRISEEIPSQLPPQPLTILEAQYLEDFQYADHYLVNSDFVKETFVASGVEAGKVSVVYWGVDAKFLEAADLALEAGITRKPLTDLLFCGGFGERKGAIELMDALDRLKSHSWTLTIAGGIEPEISDRWLQFKGQYPGRVRYLGFIDRGALAALMASHRVFVFPSLMEGSARVVFEAMASGCYVVTTPHSGSIVQDGIHGRLAIQGSTDALTEVLEDVFRSGSEIESCGLQNAALIRDSYRQDHYSARVLNVYEQLLSA